MEEAAHALEQQRYRAAKRLESRSSTCQSTGQQAQDAAQAEILHLRFQEGAFLSVRGLGTEDFGATFGT